MPSTLDQRPESTGIFALFKGDSGAGKSVGALSWPTPYVFDFDGKMPGIALKHFPGKEIHYDTFKNIFDISDKMTALWEYCPYETLIFDSVTTLVVKILNSVGEIKGDSAMDLFKKLQKTAGGGKQIELMGYDYYNAETNFIERYWLDACRALYIKEGNPKNIIIIAHVMTAESGPDIKTKIVTKTRRIVTAGRAVAAYIPTQFDDAWIFAHDTSLEDGITRRIAITQSVGEDSAKTSYRLPTTIDFTGTPPDYRDGNLFEKFTKILNHDISL
jgi:hypothetical protein